MMQVNIHIDETISNLARISADLNSRMNLLAQIGREIQNVLFEEAPVVTGNFAANIIAEIESDDLLIVTEPSEAEGGLPYAMRVLVGTRKDGSPFSEKGFELFTRNMPYAEETAINETQNWISEILA
ncbi:MAG: hypothetical protein LBC39_02635 [Methanobrevibacter sp.]|jgi:hypothetical protein|nr:hypothetical protein [Candidatus Methanovirga aequatorialis]